MNGIENPTTNERKLAKSFVLNRYVHAEKLADKLAEKDMQIGNWTLKADAAIKNMSLLESEKVSPNFSRWVIRNS